MDHNSHMKTGTAISNKVTPYPHQHSSESRESEYENHLKEDGSHQVIQRRHGILLTNTFRFKFSVVKVRCFVSGTQIGSGVSISVNAEEILFCCCVVFFFFFFFFFFKPKQTNSG